MLYIDSTNTSMQDALNLHYLSIRCLIRKKLGVNSKCSTKCKICSSRIKNITSIPNTLKRILLNDDCLKLLICGKPEDLIEIDEYIWNEMLPGFKYLNWLELFNKKGNNLSEEEKAYKQIIEYYIQLINTIIAYDDWFMKTTPKNQYSAYHLAKNLNRRSCTYCNRNFITTMTTNKKKKVMRPQFDHWFPQSKFPLLALSFYNLIPSCSICNSSVKGDLMFNLKDHIHPYIDINQSDEFSFNYIYLHSLNKYKIYIHAKDPNRKRAYNTLKLLKIDYMYNSNLEELEDLIKIKQSYSDAYIEKIKKFFKGNGLTHDEIYRLAFGTELKITDFHKRPLSKFKYDILKRLKVID